MKASTGILLSVSILFAGCFTQSSITKEEGAPDDSKVVFHIKDGSIIESYADHHPRVEGGYRLSGTIFTEGESPRKFEGLVLDNDIDKIGVDKLNVVGTLLALGIVGPLIVGMMLWTGVGVR
jgi:hypothetical protein